MTPARRRTALFAALAVTVALVAWTRAHESRDEEMVAAVQSPETPTRAVPETTATGKDEQLALERLGQRQPLSTGGDPFVARTWYEPPPPPPPEPPPKPTAPALPFQYVGQFEEMEGTGEGSGKTIVYLARGSDAYSVKRGDTLDGQYRFEGIEHGVLVFTYLPLDMRQTLPLQ